MLNESAELMNVLDVELIGFLTAVNLSGQPQSSPVWFVRDGDDIVVYNKPDTPRLDAIAVNPKVAFNLRGDRRAHAIVSIEGTAAREDLPPAQDFPGYLDKYGREIERLGWTPESFSSDYRTAIRIEVTRLRYRGLRHLVD
ncbi:MAG: pyridoxamine 5'-phosphate oxidase family protein [Acidimicrobiia bacterium]|jgi:PPOX class probable F420-dependent enzyme